jgi:hypothetical protein
MDRALRPPSPVVTIAIAALIAASTGGCGGGDHLKIAPAAPPDPVTTPDVAASVDNVAKQKATPGPKAEASHSSNLPGNHYSQSAAKRIGAAALPKDGLERDGRQGGAAVKAPVAGLPDGSEPPTAGSGTPSSNGSKNGTE